MEQKVVVLGGFIQKVLRIMNLNNDNFSILTIIKLFLTLIFLHTITYGLWGHLIRHIVTLNGRPFDFAFCANDLAGIVSSYLAVYMQMSYCIYSREIADLLSEMGNFEEYEIPEEYNKEINMLNKRTKYFVMFIHICHYFAWFLTLLQSCERGDDSACGLIITAYLPFDIFYTPMRQIFALLQCISGFHAAIATICIALIFVIMMQSLTLQLKHLGVMLMRIKHLKTKTERNKQLKECVMYHCRILYFTSECSSHSSRVLFTLVFMVSIILSLTSYTFIALNKEFVILLHLVVYVVCVSVLCMCGEKLIEESERLFPIIYDAVPWDGDVSIQKDLYIMMLMAKYELSLSAGKLGGVGHIRLMMIFKSTYSFLTLMLEV